MNNDDQYVPSEEQVRAWCRDGTGDYPDVMDEWLDRFLARVRRDAARQAEAERDEWRQTALDERGAALDALGQVKAREARIKAVKDVLDRHAHYGLVEADDIRRALDA